MRVRPIRWGSLVAALLLAALACTLPGTSDVGPQEPLATQAPVVTYIINEPPATEAPAGPPPAEAAPTTEAEPVVHVRWPEEPPLSQLRIIDRSSAASAEDRTTGGESWNLDIYERPFTAEAMDYRPDLDLIQADLIRGAPWLYVTVWLEGEPPADSAAWYGIEIDLNVDGRGDWLIVGQTPPSTEWTTDGVRACTDSDGDVGGPRPILSDAPLADLNGYETCVFESGEGVDPDAAWIRRNPADPQRIQLAFLHSLIETDEYFLWAAWADEGAAEPGWMDYNDHFTLAEAGSPTQSHADYPLKALALVDSTCRWGFGFTPNGTEPGVCYVPPTGPSSTPGQQPSCCWYAASPVAGPQCTCPCPGMPGVSPYGAVCTQESDRNLKTAVEPIDPQAVLEALVGLDISTWQYRSDNSSIRHMGPMAQDFYGAFGLGESDRWIFPIDADGVAFAAIQAMNENMEQQGARLSAMETRLDSIETHNRLSLADPGVLAAACLGLVLAAGLGFMAGRRRAPR